MATIFEDLFEDGSLTCKFSSKEKVREWESHHGRTERETYYECSKQPKCEGSKPCTKANEYICPIANDREW